MVDEGKYGGKSVKGVLSMQLGDCSLRQEMIHLMLSVSTDMTRSESPDQKAWRELVRGL